VAEVEALSQVVIGGERRGQGDGVRQGGGWWLVAGGWWLVVRGSWFVVRSTILHELLANSLLTVADWRY